MFVKAVLCGGKTQPDLCKSKAPCVASSKRHDLCSGMFCNVAGTANDVIYNSADSAALNPPLWVGFMPKRLLPYHTKQVISDNG